MGDKLLVSPFKEIVCFVKSMTQSPSCMISEAGAFSNPYLRINALILASISRGDSLGLRHSFKPALINATFS